MTPDDISRSAMEILAYVISKGEEGRIPAFSGGWYMKRCKKETCNGDERYLFNSNEGFHRCLGCSERNWNEEHNNPASRVYDVFYREPTPEKIGRNYKAREHNVL